MILNIYHVCFLPCTVLTYTVEVYTGREPGAETQADVFIQLFGSRGDTGKRVLYHSQNNDTKFQAGQMDVFKLEAVSLDDIEKVDLGHTSKAKGRLIPFFGVITSLHAIFASVTLLNNKICIVASDVLATYWR